MVPVVASSRRLIEGGCCGCCGCCGCHHRVRSGVPVVVVKMKVLVVGKYVTLMKKKKIDENDNKKV